MKTAIVLAVVLAASPAMAGEAVQYPPPPLSRGEKLAAILSPGLSQVLQAERERLIEYCHRKEGKL